MTKEMPVDCAENVAELKKLLEPWLASDTNKNLEDPLVKLDRTTFLDNITTYERYLRAHQSVPAAFSALCDTLTFRADEQPWKPCSLCQENPLAHCFRLIGFDKAKRPILYTNYSHAHVRNDREANMRHTQCLMEYGQRLMASTPGASQQWVLLTDFLGFSMRDCDPKMLVMTKNLLAHYPERLGLSLMVNSPRIFYGAWRVVKPLLNKVTIDKVKFVSLDTALDSFKEMFEEEDAKWLKRELEISREPEQKFRKYWDSGDDHDSRGMPSFVRSKMFINPNFTENGGFSLT